MPRGAAELAVGCVLEADVAQKMRLPLWPTEIDRSQLTDLIGYTQKYGVIEDTFDVDDMIWEGATTK